MAVNVTCTSCGKFMEPYIDKKDKTYCSICDCELTNISHFAKHQMKACGQIKKKEQKSFAFKCTSCGKTDRPLLNKADVVCSNCKKPMNLPEAYKIMLREQLKLVDKDI